MPSLLACPYCYETFAAREIMFRCNGRLSRTNISCALRTDPVLVQRMGIQRDLGPEFKADGRKGTAACPDCGGETTYRICPICHSTLPVQFGVVGSRMIAMAGAKDSGKTVYMTVLLHELRNRVGDRFGAAIMGADEETRKRYEISYENPLYDDNRLPPTTQRAAQQDNRVVPLVFRFSAARGLGNRPGHTLLSFFDAAGEDFGDQESVDVNTRYLACADGILLLLDPLQMAGARSPAISSTRSRPAPAPIPGRQQAGPGPRRWKSASGSARASWPVPGCLAGFTRPPSRSCGRTTSRRTSCCASSCWPRRWPSGSVTGR